MTTRRPVFFLLTLMMVCFPLLAHGYDVVLVTEKVQERYAAMDSMQADFEQTSKVQGMRHRGEYGKGTLIIQKPDKLRWDYIEPEYKVLVSDGVDISFYVRSDQQMFLSPASDYLKEDLTYRFFTGQAKLNLEFTVEKGEPAKQEEGTYCLKLTPKKPTGQMAHVYLWVERTSYQLLHLQLVDHLTTVTDFRFSNIIMNKEYAESIFVFSPPKGTEIILPGGGTVIQ